MSKKEDIDKLLYLLGEENAIEELKYPKGKHRFSEKYERRKLEMIKKYDNEETKSEEQVEKFIGKGRKRIWKRSVILAASITAVLGISLTAYGAVRMYNIAMSKDEKTGTVVYDINSDVTEIPAINIIPKYIPEGYIENKNAPGKYYLNDDFSLKNGITICSAYTSDKLDHAYVSDVENTTIGGVKAQILTREGLEFNRIILLFFEEDSQIIQIYAAENFPDDELIKVAENITYEVIPGEFIDIKANSEAAKNEQEVIGVEVKNPEIRDEDIFEINEVRNDIRTKGMTDLNYKVKSIEVLDKLEEIDPAYFCKVEGVLDEYDNYLQYINEDGTLKEYERINSEHWENNKMNKETEMVGMKFLYLTVEVNNPTDEDMIDKYFAPRIIYLDKNSDGDLEEMLRYPIGHELQIEDVPFYTDKGDYQGKHYRFADFKSKETYEIHLAYAVDEDYIDNAYISFNTTRYTNLNARDVNESYIKVVK